MTPGTQLTALQQAAAPASGTPLKGSTPRSGPNLAPQFVPVASPSLQVQCISRVEDSSWEEASCLSGASVGNTAAWCNAVTLPYGFAVHAITVRQQGRLVGFLQVVPPRRPILQLPLSG